MPDLLVITPSRGRPQNAARLLDAVHATARLETRVHILVDDDDETLPDYEKVFADRGITGFGAATDLLGVGPPAGLSAWTNRQARNIARTGEYKFFASLGDDMVPRTRGWDRALVSAIMDMGGTGFAYPWDGIREDIPEAVVMSADIVTALGWMALPDCEHFFIDDAWGELGRQAACLRHCRAVRVDHLHPVKTGAPGDATYGAARLKVDADREAYHEWRRTRMAGDVEKIVQLRESKLKK